MSNKFKSKLILQEVNLSVHLGVTPKERQKKQKIKVRVVVEYSKVPRGVKTDRIEDVDCYATLYAEFSKIKSHFALVEHLAAKLYDVVRCWTQDPKAKITLQIEKHPAFLKNQLHAVFELSA